MPVRPRSILMHSALSCLDLKLWLAGRAAGKTVDLLASFNFLPVDAKDPQLQ